MNKYGVIDRIEDNNLAIILIESEANEYVTDKALLPIGAKEGSWLFITLENNRIIEVSLDEEKTANVQRNISEQIGRIRKRSQGSKFKRN